MNEWMPRTFLFSNCVNSHLVNVTKEQKTVFFPFYRFCTFSKANLVETRLKLRPGTTIKAEFFDTNRMSTSLGFSHSSPN